MFYTLQLTTYNILYKVVKYVKFFELLAVPLNSAVVSDVRLYNNSPGAIRHLVFFSLLKKIITQKQFLRVVEMATTVYEREIAMHHRCVGGLKQKISY